MKRNHIKAFESLGTVFTGENETQAYGDCPLCGESGHFYASLSKPLWDCKKCKASGNVSDFLHQRFHALPTPSKKALRDVERDRGILSSTLKEFNVRWWVGRLMIPCDGNLNRRVQNIKRFSPGSKCISVPSGRAAFIAPRKLTSSRKFWIAEGEWDCMALWELLRANGKRDNVIGSPGASAIPQDGLYLLEGKDVTVVYDNDKAGFEGAEKIGEVLKGIASSVRIMHWPAATPDGYDIRDLYGELGKQTLAFITEQLDKPAPGSLGTGTGAGEFAGKGMPASKVEKAYTKWLHLTSTDILDVVFGTCFANRMEGDPLWMFVVGAPGAAKTEILSSLEYAPGIKTITTLTPKALVSGSSGVNQADPSLLPKLDGKVLVIKDFTTILSMRASDREEVFSVLRDAYDGYVEKHFGSGPPRVYRSHFGILAAVTPVIDAHANRSGLLGERFIRYRIENAGVAGGIKTVRRALVNTINTTKMRNELRAVAAEALDVDMSEFGEVKIGDNMINRVSVLAQWTAVMRGVVEREPYSGLLTQKPCTEVGTRLARQLYRLGCGIALYRRERAFTNRTFHLLTKVARGSASGQVEDVVRLMFLKVEEGKYVDVGELSKWTRYPVESMRRILQDLQILGAVEQGSARGSWRLAKRLRKMINQLGVYRTDEQWKAIQQKESPW